MEVTKTFYLNEDIERGGEVYTGAYPELLDNEIKFIKTLTEKFPSKEQSVRTINNDYILLEPLAYSLYEESLVGPEDNVNLSISILEKVFFHTHNMLMGVTEYDKRFPGYMSNADGANYFNKATHTLNTKYNSIKKKYTHYNGIKIQRIEHHILGTGIKNFFLKEWLYKLYGNPHETKIQRYEIKKIFFTPEEEVDVFKDVSLTKPRVKLKKEAKDFDSDGIVKTYLMKDKNTGSYKIGKSTTPKFRERTLQSEKPNIIMVKVWTKDIELTLHKLYRRQQLRGEWFNLSKIQVRYICTHF